MDTFSSFWVSKEINPQLTRASFCITGITIHRLWKEINGITDELFKPGTTYGSTPQINKQPRNTKTCNVTPEDKAAR